MCFSPEILNYTPQIYMYIHEYIHHPLRDRIKKFFTLLLGIIRTFNIIRYLILQELFIYNSYSFPAEVQDSINSWSRYTFKVLKF